MNEQGTELIDSLNRLSLSSLSKSSPSNIQPFQLKSSRLMQPPMPPLPNNNVVVDKNKPSNLSHVPCKFFKQGTCTAGANCIFSHNPDPTSESSVCKYFRKGNCKFGAKCALLHTMSPFSTSTTTNNNSNNNSNGNNTSSSSNNNKLFISNNLKNLQQQQQQLQQPSSFSSFNSASSRFLFDQFYAVNENYNNNSNDPFASSAPSPSPFSMLLDERRSKMMPNNDSQFLSSNSYNKPFLFHPNSSNSSNSGGININQPQQQPLHSIPEGNRSYRSYHHQEEDVNDFMLPSSLNDLLTPTELLQQLQFPTMQSSFNSNGSRQLSHEAQQQQHQPQQWNVPFYTNSTTNGTISSGSYSYDESSPSSLPLQPITNRYQQPINIPSGGSSSSNSNNNLEFMVDYPDEDGPFIMEDTLNHCIEQPSQLKSNTSTNTTTENYSTYNIIKHL